MGIVQAAWYTGTCPNCGRSEWCRQSNTGAYMCRRAPGPGLLERRDRHGVPYWLHLPAGVKITDLEPGGPDVDRATPQELQAVYGTILKRLKLSQEHLADWKRRGVSEAAVVRHWVRSWPAGYGDRRHLAAELYLEFGEVMRRVPGWYVRDGRPMLAGGSGWVIPMWDLETGCVVALRIRSDSDSGPKYYWLSSAKKGGTSPGVHARLAWPGRAPRPDDTADTVRVTEGEAKSIVLAGHTGIPTLSVPGVAMWTLALPWLRWLNAQKVLICFDSDFAENRHVASALLDIKRNLPRHGFTATIETWRRRR